MESISVFDMLKIGVGPSSSHTLGPWRAASLWIQELKSQNIFEDCSHLKVDLYGSLSLTGKGHATDIALVMGLLGEDPVQCDTETISDKIELVKTFSRLSLNGEFTIDFSFENDIVFNKKSLPFHPNGLRFTAYLKNNTKVKSTFYSVGGGFVTKEDLLPHIELETLLPYPIEHAADLLQYCKKTQLKISEIVFKNETSWQSPNEIDNGLDLLWKTMKESIYKGCHSQGFLPGGLSVKRRASEINAKLIKDLSYTSSTKWIEHIRKLNPKFHEILKWISCFALGVNEVNASMGKVVTAPTNGSAGVIPAVIMYYLCFVNKFAGQKEVRQFLLVAGEIGSIFKRNATISAAMGGCQAEIGVSSAMAAAALTEVLGGTPTQVTMAAEIAMEHHLGMTCDPIGGLVQVPCIERNSMGAIKAIHAAELALESDSNHAKVSLDKVIDTMWETAKAMNTNYKETSEGGLAVVVGLADC